MQFWQELTILGYAVFSFLVFVKGVYESAKKKNAYGATVPLYWMGVFVWGDAVIFGLFWALASLTCLLLGDWILFLLLWSVFWLVRSFGETIYWFAQQFSTIEREPPESLPFYAVFRNQSVWFGMQIFHQAITVTTIITTIYLAALWLPTVI